MRCSGWPVTYKWLVCLAILLIFSGCAQMKTFFKSDGDSAEVKQAGKSTSYYAHKVRWEGETLSLIAKWYTGKFENWRGIVKANPKLNPNRMYIGCKILIPEDLVENRKPMPQEFLGKVASKRNKK